MQYCTYYMYKEKNGYYYQTSILTSTFSNLSDHNYNYGHFTSKLNISHTLQCYCIAIIVSHDFCLPKLLQWPNIVLLQLNNTSC